MATITNQCDVLLQATTPRMLNVSSNFITVTPTTNAFSTTATSTSPSSIAVRASLSGELRGTVTWSTAPTVAFTVTGNVLTLPATSVAAGSSVTVTATLTLYGQTYTNSATISHQADTVTSSLSSSAVTISTNTDGTGGTYTSATSTMTVTIGTVDNSTSWAYAWTVPAGVTATGQATRTIAVSAMTVDTATLTCTATRAGWATQTKSFTVSKSKNGSIGTNGTRTAILDLYRWSVTTPTTFPVGTSTYTWATAQFTTPATLNSWTTTPGASVAGQTLYIARQIYTDSLSTATSTVTWSTNTATVLSSAGTNGVNGTRTAFLEVYRWSATVPTTFPAGTSTYTWATGAFTAPGTPNSWSLTPGASAPGQTLYACSVRFSDNLTTTTSSVTWNTSTAYVVGAAGSNGAAGANGSATYLIDRGASTSSTAPTVAEVTAATSRSPILGDIANIKYNNGTNAISYRCTLGGASATWTVQTSYLAGSLIIENTLSASKITNGTTATLTSTSGTFSLGDQTFLIFPTTVSVTANGAEKWAITGYNYSSTGFAHGIGAGSSSPDGFGVLGYSANNVLYTNMRSIGALGQSGSGVTAKHYRPSSYGTTNNLTSVDNEFLGGHLDCAAIFTSYRNNSTGQKFQAFIAPSNSTGVQQHCAVFGRWTDAGVFTEQVFLAAQGYSVLSASGRGKMYAYDGFTPFTGAHHGVHDNTDLPEIGDIVVDIALLERGNISSTLLKQAISTAPYQKTVIGVFTGTEDLNQEISSPTTIYSPSTMGETVNSSVAPQNPIVETYELQNEVFININSLGEGQINVCGENGNIEAGDLIVTSSIPGKGMRQDNDLIRSCTVAKARESVTFSSPTEVKMIACTYLCG